MTFEESLQYARDGRKIRLPHWTKAYITVQYNNQNPELVMYSNNGVHFEQRLFSLPPQEIMSSAWEIYEHGTYAAG